MDSKKSIILLVGMMAACTSRFRAASPTPTAQLTPMPTQTHQAIALPAQAPIVPAWVERSHIASTAGPGGVNLPQEVSIWTLDGFVRDTPVITVDHDGTLWVAGQGGLVHFDGEKWTSYDLPEQLNVTSISVAQDETVWISTFGEGVFSFDGATWKRYKAHTGAFTHQVMVAPDGKVWVAGEDIFSFDGTTWKSYMRYASPGSEQPPSESDVCSSTVAPDGTLWFGSCYAALGEKLFRFDGKAWTSFAMPDDFTFISSIAVTKDGLVWVGTVGEGGSAGELLRFDGKDWVKFTAANGLTDDYVMSLAAAPDGAVWLGTNKGVCRFDGKACTTLLADKIFASIDITANGEVWLIELENPNRLLYLK